MPELPDDVVLDAGGLTLRRLGAGDTDAVAAILRDPETRRWAHPDGADADAAASAIAKADAEWREGVAADLAIVEGDAVVGTIGVRFYEPARASVGFDVAPAHRGRGVATRGLAAVCAWAFETFPALTRIELWALPGNDASLRVAERAGFRREGVLRSRLPFGSGLRDVVVCSLLRDDPR